MKTVERFIESVCAKIRFQQYRNAVQQELRDHLEQKTMQLMRQGMDQPQAEQKAVEDMGDEGVIACGLNRVHIFRYQRIVLWACYAATLFLGFFIWKYFSSVADLFDKYGSEISVPMPLFMGGYIAAFFVCLAISIILTITLVKSAKQSPPYTTLNT